MIERNQGRTLREVLENLREITSREPVIVERGREWIRPAVVNPIEIPLAEGSYLISIDSSNGPFDFSRTYVHEARFHIGVPYIYNDGWGIIRGATLIPATFCIESIPRARDGPRYIDADGITIIRGYVTSRSLTGARHLEREEPYVGWCTGWETIMMSFTDLSDSSDEVLLTITRFND